MNVLASLGHVSRRVGSSPVVVVMLSLIAAIALLAVLAPVISPYDHQAQDLNQKLLTPQLADRRWFGTEDLGRDMFVLTMMGVRISLLVAIVASIVSLVIGVIYGAIAGYAGGRVDAVMMRIVDTLYALPFIFFVILLMVYFERNFLLIFVAIGAINWLDMARIVRGQTLSLKEREFVDAARLMGVSPLRIVLRHITPNLLGVVVVYVTLTVPQAMLMESFLSYLGLGVQDPAASLGSLVDLGVEQMERAPYVLLIPASFLAVILLAFNFLGDGLRDLLDPRESRR